GSTAPKPVAVTTSNGDDVLRGGPTAHAVRRGRWNVTAQGHVGVRWNLLDFCGDRGEATGACRPCHGDNARFRLPVRRLRGGLRARRPLPLHDLSRTSVGALYTEW